jgi:hypothetical protein
VTIVTGKREKFRNDVMVLERGEFGWQYEKHDDFHTKLSYAYTLAAPYNWCSNQKDTRLTPSNREMKMLETFLKTHLKTKKIIWTNNEGYVDHDSEWLKGVIFESDETLADFLLVEGSYLQLDNDNREDYYEERDKTTVYGKTV